MRRPGVPYEQFIRPYWSVPGGSLLSRIRTLHLSLVLGLLWSILAIGPAVAAPGDIGVEGPSYAGAGADPTGEKPESKTWFADGVWWGSLWDTASGRYEIFRMSTATQTWSSTNVGLDTRTNSRADTLWTGSKLYVASHVFSESPASGFPSWLYRFTYNAATDMYSLDAGWPQQINNVRSETLVIDQDSTGQLWATWVQNDANGQRRVHVNRTVSGDSTWGTPFVPPGNPDHTRVASDDVSTIVAFGGNRIGLLWSNQRTSPKAFNFMLHMDTSDDETWGNSIALSGSSSFGDDHINLKSIVSDGTGRIFAAIKTSNTGSSEPSIVLLARSAAGAWSFHTIWTVSNDMTRPIVLLDLANSRIHAFASEEGGGAVMTKSSSLSSVSFPSGAGTVVMDDDSHSDINNVTSTKQNLSAGSGLLVLASNDATDRYWHHYDPLGSGGGGSDAPVANFSATPRSGSAPLAVTFTDTSTNAPTAWAWTFGDGATSAQQHPSHTYTAAGSYTVTLTATNADGSDGETKSGYITVSPSGGGGLTVAPSDDTYVTSSSASAVNGSANNLRVRNSGSTQLHTYLKFSVSGAGSVGSATLRLWVLDASADGGALFEVPDSTWSESSMSWNTRKPISGGAIDSAGAVGVGSWVELDVSALVSGDGTYSFALINNSSDVARYASSEASVATRPQLVLSGP
jgi:PKD repeat protein